MKGAIKYMRYYSEEYVRNIHLIPVEHKAPQIVNIRFCRDCPLFEPNYWQKDPVVTSGWCRRMSYYETMEDEPPFYVYVNSNSFCNEDDIREEDE